MNSNQKKLQRMIRRQEFVISDQEFFLSAAFQNHLTSLARASTGRFQQGLQVVIDWDESKNADVAYTDSYKTYCNAANTITQSFPTRFLRALSLIGLDAHETAHLLFTDFITRNLYLTTLHNGSFYPEVPVFTQPHCQENLKEIQALMKKKDKAACQALAICAADLENILEDIYVEAKMCDAFPGTFRQGIRLNNYRMTEQIPDLSDQLAEGYAPFAVISNLLLSYCRVGEIPNNEELSNEYTKALDDCKEYVDTAIKEGTMVQRLQTTNCLLVLFWDFVRPMIEPIRRKLEMSEMLRELSDLFGNQLFGRTTFPTKEDGGVPVNLPLPPGLGDTKSRFPFLDEKERQEDAEEVRQAIAEEGQRMEWVKTTHILDGDNPGVTYSSQYTGSGYENAASDILRVLQKAATEKAHLEYEQNLTIELQKAAQEINYGNMHKGIHVIINRMSVVPEHLIRQYNLVAPSLLPTSRRLQQMLRPLIKDEEEGGKQKNLLFGKRLDMRSLHHEDGSFFIQNRLPCEEQRLAVVLVLDESSSMEWLDRITHVRKTAIVLYDVCTGLKIPIMIYGHTTRNRDVMLYSYAEFDSVDHQDKYRLMDISARNSNRDGAALRFAAERLAKRPETWKLLILMSDGQPSAYGYYGSAAEEDLRSIKKEFEKQGVHIFSAAIGDDKENIQRIYGDGFLDITRLDDLPKNLSVLIKQYLK